MVSDLESNLVDQDCIDECSLESSTETGDNAEHSTETSDNAEHSTETSDNAEHSTETSDNAGETETELEISETHVNDILLALKSTKRSLFWRDKETCYLRNLFKNTVELEQLRDYELKTIMAYLKALPNTENLRVSASKADKISQLDDFLNGRVSKRKTKGKLKTTLTLKELCCKRLLSKEYPKDVLVSALAQTIYPQRLQTWKDNSKVADVVTIQGLQPVSTYYHPEYSRSRNQLEVKVIDGTHIRNNIRSALCKNNIENIRKEAWVQVAKVKKSPLKLSLLELQADGKVLDQQKEEYARLMFCPDVQKIMRTFIDKNENLVYKQEAEFCKLINNWTRAEDEPVLDACKRIKHSLELKQWLLKDVEFDKFPPPSIYI